MQLLKLNKSIAIEWLRHLGSHHLGAARTMFNQMYPLWISKSLSTRAKIKLCKFSVVTIARHGSESWCLVPDSQGSEKN